ncbi:MAG: hypothetical protein HRU15_10590 [Planctomycetes bacterium]|nr:hypothetical protein [Planctomycetota bacterium]
MTTCYEYSLCGSDDLVGQDHHQRDQMGFLTAAMLAVYVIQCQFLLASHGDHFRLQSYSIVYYWKNDADWSYAHDDHH